MSCTAEATEEVGHHETKRDYLLVMDLPEMVHGLRLTGLNVPPRNHDIFAKIKEDLAKLFGVVMPKYVGESEITLKVIDMQELSDQILAKAVQMVDSMKQGYIVSTCMDIASIVLHGKVFEANRLIDNTGSVLGIGPRPGHYSLRKQVESVITDAAGQPIILVEDGLFTGTTMYEVIREFQARGAEVEAVVLGFAFPKAKDKLASLAMAPSVHTVETVHNPLDWVPDHDFFPFVPNCGRVLGTRINGQVHPIYSHLGFSYSVPYLYGFCPMGDWIGLSLSEAQARELTWNILHLDCELFRVIDAMNGGKGFKLHELGNARPRVSIPYRVNQKHLPENENDMTIGRHLAEETMRASPH
ncbi:MAG: phosphoribosyltransferase [bacterium]|nr:phosphoribosyltransferase [bacterium]MDZ4347330.1 phosphoribosyltransferase [Candidatus Binatia bacterium]